ncbi:MAG: peptide deformylase [Deltaproteobacteria bacterium]|nr:MAG: peptide deformylase [Deltaproteobacteria bacterium]
MAVLDIVTFPDPRLRQPTITVQEIDEGIRALVRDLTDTMYAHDGAGIAAIQVGRPERIFLVDGRVATGDPKADPVVFINPEIVETGGGVVGDDEGCLSFPGVFVEVRRPRRAKVRATDLDGRTFEIEGEGLLGRALQHEFDHLEGRLLIDMVGFVKKEMIRRRLKRWYAEQGRAPAAAL